MNLSELKVGDKVAIPILGSWYDKLRIHNAIVEIERVTATQLVCGTYRIRRSDGHVIGETYLTAVIATPELIEENRQQTERRERWYKAKARVDHIEEVLTRRKLTVEQMEKLADVYESFCIAV